MSTPKPWEETWEATERGRVQLAGGGEILTSSATDGPPDLERAKLAAAAPNMARLLRDLGCQWDGSWASWFCRCCERSAEGRTEEDGPPASFPHAENCLLVAVLRKAGVL